MTHVEALVSRQVMLSELKRRLEAEGLRPAPVRVGGVVYGPCLSVSRECGSGGRQLAEHVGRRLGWWVIDREIVDEIAQRSHVRQRLVESVDERVRSKWTQGFGWLVDSVGLSPGEYLFQLRQVLLTLGHHGDVIIMGRGAHYILPSRGVLRLRLVAPVEARVQRVASREHLPMAEARRWVEVRDRERDEFIRRTFSRDPYATRDYDLVLNTGEIGVEAGVEIVLVALHGKFGELTRMFPSGSESMKSEESVAC